MRRLHARRFGVSFVTVWLVATLVLLLERSGASAQEREGRGDERAERRRGDRERDREEGREEGRRRAPEGDREGERDRERRFDRERGDDRERGGRALAHMVFFDVAEESEEAREKLVAACKEYLSGHRGTVHFSVGVIAEELDREVNDREFDVALHLIFRNKAAHDRYQEHPRHLEFIEKNKDLWKGARVFDSYLSPRRDREGDRSRRLPLPDAASGFAGLVRGRVLRVGDGGRVVLAVSEVVREWEQSRASDAKSLEGRRVLVVPSREGEERVRRFLESLRPEEDVTLDVGHRRGEALVVLELTADQRERAGRIRRERGDRERGDRERGDRERGDRERGDRERGDREG